ncbi:MAG: FliO/MopB family protein [Solirubrobacteraceae bacterium]|nr:FliO/MopB family protein [Solirubrobacteraceae bacterium]
MSRSLLRPVATATLAFLLLAPAHAAAQGGSTTASGGGELGEATPLNLDTATQGGDGGGSGGGSLVRTIVGLAIVIAVIYGVTWVLKQVKASREERTRGTALSTAAVVALGPGRSLHLVRAGRELLLVGVSDHAVVPIRTYTEEEAQRLGLDVPDEPAGPAPRRGGGRGGTTAAQLMDRLRERTIR